MTFKYSYLGGIVLLVFICYLCFLFRGLFEISCYSDLFFFILLLCLLLYAVYVLLSEITFRVITDSEELVVKNLFMSHIFKWEDICEIGRRKRGLGNYRFWMLYVVTNKERKRKDICYSYINNINDLINILYFKATNAQFMTIDDASIIPFTRREIKLPWDRNIG